jgi:hypothetical protein
MKDSGHENYVSPPTPADSDSSSLQCAYDLEPIAIIGLSCRFPDGASNPQKLWTKLASGSSAWSKGPGNRYNFGTFIEPKNSHPTTVSFTLSTFSQMCLINCRPTHLAAIFYRKILPHSMLRSLEYIQSRLE